MLIIMSFHVPLMEGKLEFTLELIKNYVLCKKTRVLSENQVYVELLYLFLSYQNYFFFTQ